MSGPTVTTFALPTLAIVKLHATPSEIGALAAAQIGYPYVALFVSGALVAIAAPIYNVTQVSYRQALVSARLQGRTNATIRTIVWGTLPLGGLAGGFLASATSVTATIVCGTLVCALATLWLIPVGARRSDDRATA